MATAPREERLLAALDDAEAAARRSRPLLLLGFALLVAAFVSLSIYLHNARAAAERARDAAVEEALEKNSAANAAANAMAAALVALENGDSRAAADVLRTALRKQEAVAATSLPVRDAGETEPSAAPSPVAQAPVTTIFQKAAEETTALAFPSYPAAGKYEVFIQFAGRIIRSRIVSLNQGLRSAGWNVQGPSGERIATASGLNEVRYKLPEDAEAAKALAAALDASGIPGRTVQARQLDIIRTGTLEVWISN